MVDLLPPVPKRCRLSPEFRLVTACSWVAPPPHDEVQAQTIVGLFQEAIDWEQFLALVRRHGVAAQAFVSLQRCAAEQVPTTVLQALKQQRLGVAAQALLQETELCRLNQLFTHDGISMISLKGILLSLCLYGDTKMRSSSDLDLLVQPADLARADQLLRRSGYRRLFPGEELTQRQMEFLSRGFHHFNYLHTANGLHVELHWRGWLWTPEQTAILWEHQATQEWSGQSFHRLAGAAELLYLSEHGAGHKWFRLKWLSDIAMLLAMEQQMGWRDIVALAARCGLQRILAQSALLVWWLYGIHVPRELGQLIGEERNTVWCAEASLDLLLMSEKEITHLGRRFESVRMIWYLLRIKPSMPYWMLLKGILISPADMKLVRLPYLLFWLYLPLRPFFWIWRNFLRQYSR